MAKELYNAILERDAKIVGTRIQEARERRGLTRQAFADLLKNYGVEISRYSINKWEWGTVMPNVYQFLAICHALEIEDAVAYFSGWTAPKSLNAEGLQKLSAYKEDLIASGRYAPEIPVSRQITYIDMPVSILPASAGTGALLSEEMFEMVSVPANTVPAGAERGIRIRGDSMEPVYVNDSIAWIQETDTLRPGEVGVFMYDGEGYIKVYDEQEPDEDLRDMYLDSNGVLHKQPALISYNQKYAPKVISPELPFQIVGRVLN